MISGAAAINKKPEIKDHPLYELEQIASSVLYGAGSCIVGYRVDIEKLIEIKYHLIITTHYHLKEYGVEAFTLTKGKRIFVDFHLLDNPSFDKRYRFTLAEELAHLIIHHKVYEDCSTIEERIQREKQFSRQDLSYLETNAKALASAILMPKLFVEERMEKLFSIIGTDSKYTIPIITTLSKDFDVSKPAVTRRLKNLGYHKRSNLQLKS